MDIFDKITNAANKTYEYTSNKTSKFAKETRLRFNMNECKSKIYDLYEEIGKDVYEVHLLSSNDDEDSKNEIIVIKDEVNEYLKQIDKLGDNVEYFRQELLKLNKRKQCNKCKKQIDISVKYCPYCGEKQNKEENSKEYKKENDDYNKNSIIENKTNEENKNSNNEIEGKKKILVNEVSNNYESEENNINDNNESNSNITNNHINTNLNNNDSNKFNIDEIEMNPSDLKNVISKNMNYKDLDGPPILLNSNLDKKIKKEIDGENYVYNNDLNKNNKNNNNDNK